MRDGRDGDHEFRRFHGLRHVRLESRRQDEGPIFWRIIGHRSSLRISSWCRPQRGRLLFVLVLLAHARRRVVHVAVTAHPTAAWTAQQLRDAFPWDEAPRDVLPDRDHAFDGWADPATAMGMDDLLTAPRSPWQHASVERFIGTVRRECLDHVIVFNATALQRLMHRYTAYDERSRTHLSLDKDAPMPRPVALSTEGRIVAIPQVGGLHRRYERHAT